MCRVLWEEEISFTKSLKGRCKIVGQQGRREEYQDKKHMPKDAAMGVPKTGTLNTQHGCVVGKYQKEAGKVGGTII